MLKLHPLSSPPRILTSASSGARGFDTGAQLNAAMAQAFVRAGFTFAIRCLACDESKSSGSLTADEAEAILSSGLALMPVQRPSELEWHPTRALGDQHGEQAMRDAQAAGLPAGSTIWLDLEGAGAYASIENVVGYINAWSSAVSAKHYLPGLYLGCNTLPNDASLNLLEVSQFWRSGPGDLDAGEFCFRSLYPANGYCLLQTANGNLDGISYYEDVVQADNLGRTPAWLQERATCPNTENAKPPEPEKDQRTGKSRSQAAGIGVAALVAVFLYLAGAMTGKQILPKLQSLAAAIEQHLPASKPVSK